MSWRGGLALVALCVAAAVGGFSAHRFWQAGDAVEATGEIRPDLEFQGLDGQPHKLSEWNGKLLLLNFWATWCTPCLKEIPLLVEAQKAHGANGLQIVGIALDKPELVQQFRDRFQINYPLMVGEADVIRGMDALGDTLGAFPFSVLIAPDGRILQRVSGDLSPEEFEELLGPHLP